MNDTNMVFVCIYDTKIIKNPVIKEEGAIHVLI